MMLKSIALAFFAVFWLIVVVRLMMRSAALDKACAQIPLDDDVTTPRIPEAHHQGARSRTDR